MRVIPLILAVRKHRLESRKRREPKEPVVPLGVKGTKGVGLTPTPGSEKEGKQMELYINNTWTERYGNAYMAEAIAWSESGNHATIYTVGSTADEADAKLMHALRELKLVPDPFTKGDICSPTGSERRNSSGSEEVETDKKADT